MDAAAHPAGEAFPAQPEAPPAPAKPAAPPALEPGAQWKALPFKLRKKIENATTVAGLAIYVPVIIAWACLANAKIVAWRRLLAEEKLLVSNVLSAGVALAMAFLIFAGYQYLRHVSPNKTLLWDGIRGYYHKWRTHRNNARAAISEMSIEPALQPETNVRSLAVTGRDALVFGGLALLFAKAAACLLVCDLLGLLRGAEGSGEPYAPGEAFLLVTTLAAAVFGFIALTKGGTFVTAWRRFVFASAKRGVLGWWREFSASDDWKRFVSIRPTFTRWRCALFAVLLCSLVYGTHALSLYALDIAVRQQLSMSNRDLIAVCRTDPLGYFSVLECGAEHGQFRVNALPQLSGWERLAHIRKRNWYVANALNQLDEGRFRRAESIGWTGARMEEEAARAAKEVEKVRYREPFTADEFDKLLKRLAGDGFSYSRKDDSFDVKFNNEKFYFYFSESNVTRVMFDGSRLMVLTTDAYRQDFEVFDFARALYISGILSGMASGPVLQPPFELRMHLPFWLAVFALVWSIPLAPLLFLRFTYDPDKERVKQAAAAASPAPAATPAAPPST